MSRSDADDRLTRFLDENRIMSYRNADGDIETLDLRSECTTDEVLALLHALPFLRKLVLQGTRITDTGLSSLSKLSQLEEVDLRSCPGVTDEGMKHVAKIAALKKLELYETNIGNTGLDHLTRLENIEQLNLHTTQVTDSGLAQLQSLPRLRNLEIGGPGVTDACLEDIGRLYKLDWLSLNESSFSDIGLAKLGELVRLTHLSIAWTEINGSGFRPLSNLKKLTWLHASESRFSDEGLKHVAYFQKLKTLSLACTQATDEGLIHLEGLKRLKHLNLEGTRVTKEGKASLKQALPRCVIVISRDRKKVDVEQYDAEYFWSHRPRCVAGFISKAVRDEDATTFQLACSCGCDTGVLLGYPLSQFKADYEGTLFVGPLAFQCSQCHEITEIIDTEAHGYDGELGNSVTFRGTGERVVYRCLNCDSEEMRVVVHFKYDGGALDLKADEPDIAVEDFFGSFSADGVCLSCQARSSVAEFECA